MRIRKDLIELYKPTNGTKEFTGFILVTAENYVGIREKAIEAGFNGFVPVIRGGDTDPGETPYVLIEEEINFPDVLPVNNGALNLQYVVPRTAAFYLRFTSEYRLPSGNVTFDITADGVSIVSETVPVVEGSSGIVTPESIVVLEKGQVLDIAVSGLSEEGTSLTSNVLAVEETTERTPLVFNNDSATIAAVDPLEDGVLVQITAKQDGLHNIDVALPVTSEGASFTVKLLNGATMLEERVVSASETMTGTPIQFNVETMFVTDDVLTLVVENFSDGTAWINQFPNAPALASASVLKILPGTEEMVVVLGTEDNAEIYTVDANWNWTKFGDHTAEWYFDSNSLANLGGGLLYSGKSDLTGYIVNTANGMGTDVSTESGSFQFADIATRASFAGNFNLDASQNIEWVNITGGANVPALNNPYGFAVENGLVYVADINLRQIWIKNLDDTWTNIGVGTGAPNWSSPRGLAVENGILYVSDTGLDQIWRKNLDDTWTNLTGGAGAPNWLNPRGIGVENGLVYVADYSLKQIWRKNLDGTWTNVGVGTGAPNWGNPAGLAVENGLVYVADYTLDQIWRRNLDESWTDIGGGTGAPTWSTPYGLAVEGGLVYVTDYDIDQIWRRNLDGTWTNVGEGAGAPVWEFSVSIAVENGTVYIADSNLDQVWKTVPVENNDIRDYMVADNVAYIRGTFGGLWERTSAGVWTDVEAESEFPSVPIASMFFADDWLYLFTQDVSSSKRRNVDGTWESWTTTADNSNYLFPQHFDGKMYGWSFDGSTGNLIPSEFDPVTGATTALDSVGGPAVLALTEPAVWHGSFLYGAVEVDDYDPSTDGPVDPNAQPRMYYRRLAAGTASSQEGGLVTQVQEKIIPDRYQYVYEPTDVLTNEVVFDDIVLPETAETHIFYQLPYNLKDQNAEVKILVNGTVVHVEGLLVEQPEMDTLTFATALSVNQNDVLSVEHVGFVDAPKERIYETVLTVTQLAGEAEYDPTISVPRGALVRYLGKFYRCIRDYPGTDLDLSQSTYFQLQTLGDAYVTPFSTETFYEKGDIILLGKALYFSKTDTQGSFDANNWVKMETGTRHDDMTRYSDGTLGIVRGTCINILDNPNTSVAEPVFYTSL